MYTKGTIPNSESDIIDARKGLLALSPVALFLILYVAVSAAVGDFYKIPISVALSVAAAWAVAIYRHHPLQERIEVFSRAAGHANILYMIWVFVLAGAFAAAARHIGAVDATVGLIVDSFPHGYMAPMLFVASCFISFAIGTSVGTVVALAPLARDMAIATGADVPFFIGVTLGGAFFGDNLSFISDTTIAATRSQCCAMSDKFKANLWLAIPAAVATLTLYMLLHPATGEACRMASDGNIWLLLPYLAVIASAVAGINVTIVMSLGIIATLVVGMCTRVSLIDMAGAMGTGINSMGELIIVTLLASGILGIIKAAGGIQYLLQQLTSHLRGARGAQATIVVLVSLVNLCTANNTVAIITVGGIVRDVAKRFGLDPRKVASLLDSASCVVQSLIPYGAQTLLATSLAGISPVAPFPYLYYPWALGAMIILSIIFRFPRRLNKA